MLLLRLRMLRFSPPTPHVRISPAHTAHPTRGSEISHISIQNQKYSSTQTLTILRNHRHPDPRLEYPEILLRQLPEIDSLIRFEVECEFTAVPGCVSKQYN